MTTKRFGTEDIGINKLDENLKENPKNVKNSDWRKVLPDEVFRVARESGTERPGTGGFDNYFEKGRYVCLCCGSELFNSDAKFWAGCGWPAFSESIGKDANITRIVDKSHGMVRTEVRCKTCDAHLGHVFNDGPKETTGERYCINSGTLTKRRPNNERSAISEVKHFLCYLCGDFLPNILDYQKHILNHQLFSYSYQIWNSKQDKNRRRSRGLEKLQDGAESSTNSSSDNNQQTGESSGVNNDQDVPKSVKRRKTTSKEEKSHAAEESDAKKKEAKQNSDRIRSIFHSNSKRSCDKCQYTCDKFSTIIAHQVEVHQASFHRVTMFLFKDDFMFLRKVSPPGKWCPRCNLKLVNDTQYYLHLLELHVPDVAFQLKEKYGEINNQDTEVCLKRPDKTEVVYDYNYKYT